MTLEALRLESSASDLVLDSLHRELFGFNGLGRNLLCPSWRPSELSRGKLASFKVEGIYKVASASFPWYSLTSIGLDLEKVNVLDKTYLLPSIEALLPSTPIQPPCSEEKHNLTNPTPKTLLLEKGVNETTLGVAFKIAGYNQHSLTDNLKFLILKEIFSESIPVPFGTPIGKWSSKLIDSAIFIAPIFHQYSDVGLIGFTLSLPINSKYQFPDRTLVSSGKIFIENDLLFNLSEEQFKIAKATAKLRIAESSEDIRSFSIGIGKRILNKTTLTLPSISEMMNAVDSIDINTIKLLQKSIFSHRPSSIIIGPTLSGVSL